MIVVSVVLPTFNELRHGLLERILGNLPRENWLEVVAVDSGSSDGTRDLLRRFPHVQLIEMQAANRAQRLNRGIEHARGSLVFLHHPRSLPDPQVFGWLKQNLSTITWGALTHTFDMDHRLLRFTSWYSNRVRGDWSGIYYLDHCLFFQKHFWFPGAMPPVDVFEDTLLCQELRRQARPMRLPFKSVTSAVRFRRNGVWRQALLNQLTKVAFWSGVPPRLINKFYERGMNLNDRARR